MTIILQFTSSTVQKTYNSKFPDTRRFNSIHHILLKNTTNQPHFYKTCKFNGILINIDNSQLLPNIFNNQLTLNLSSSHAFSHSVGESKQKLIKKKKRQKKGATKSMRNSQVLALFVCCVEVCLFLCKRSIYLLIFVDLGEYRCFFGV